MKIVFLVHAHAETGLGHWYRTIELAKRAKAREHHIVIASNRMVRGFPYFQIRENNESDLYHVLHQFKPDWIVIDLQYNVPDYIYELSKAKIAVLNGVGYSKEDQADLTVIQGFSDKKHENILSGPKHVVLRHEIFLVKQSISTNSQKWFVWGGTKDKMNLLSRFPNAMTTSTANLIINKNFPIVIEENINPEIHTPIIVDDISIIPIMAISERACVAMGMIAWELAALEVPTYAFSVSAGHLEFALKMQEHGLLMAYPETGMPESDKIAQFLSSPFKINGEVPDEHGADRILDRMEKL